MRDTIRITLDQDVTPHEDGDFYELHIAGYEIETSIPIDATSSKRLGAKGRAERALIQNGLVPERVTLIVEEDMAKLFPAFEVRVAEPETETPEP